MLSGATGVWSALPESVQRALAIEPVTGSSYLDAEHVVVLMQENRSFDHCFGSLQGVRGFNDPRAVRLPNRNPVWLQSNKQGETYGPFRLNINETNSTWMGSLPHSWTNQVDAKNNGKHNGWLDAKHSGNSEYAKMPLTMGYYTREDIPFYYAFADAFTVCDQHFCSSLTGTTPNRVYLWTGTIRGNHDADSFAHVLNDDIDYPAEAAWTTFPERLEDAGISWKIYQNEISLDSGLEGESDAWLTNFTDNPIEWFSQYHVRYSSGHQAYLHEQVKTLPAAIAELQKQLDGVDAASGEAGKLGKQITEKTENLKHFRDEATRWSMENFHMLTEKEKALHIKAFCTNIADPSHRELTTISYPDGGKHQEVQVPKGDVLHQFRHDAASGVLPAVSWLVAPERFSDHPGSAWYGAWYVSEVLDILTKDPDVWKKTILILTYDENDGYFDHVPPFAAPDPNKPSTGRTSDGIDTGVEYVTVEQELKRKPAHECRESSIGLGFRVPMIIASPWTRGGAVCSQVFDHTSVLQFLEVFLTHKTGKSIREPNITKWRRTVCGNLTSAFQTVGTGKTGIPHSPPRDAFIKSIYQAKFKRLPSDYNQLTADEIARARTALTGSIKFAPQEKGIRRSCPLPYQLYAEASIDPKKSSVSLTLECRKDVFGQQSAGSPFNVYLFDRSGDFEVRHYAVAAGSSVTDSWSTSELDNGHYHLHVHGPNGFFREFHGEAGAAVPLVVLEYPLEYPVVKGKPGVLNGTVAFMLANTQDARSHTFEIHDNAYRSDTTTHLVPAGGSASIRLDLKRSHGWYDFTVRIAGNSEYIRRYAGRVETGNWSYSDPAMGGELS